jgi:hypothetical protein
MKTLMRLTWHILALTLVVVVIALLTVLTWPAAPRANAAVGLSQKVHLYYYAWYGNPSFNGSWRHWNQAGHSPPNDIAANFYPSRGAYDSGDFAGTVNQHMQWIQQAGVGVIALSWWGQGSYEDTKATSIMDKANLYGIKVAFHIEPYGGRTPSSVVSDVNYINSHYGSHPAYFRAADYGNRPVFYIFNTHLSSDWSPIAPLKANNIIMEQTWEDTPGSLNFSGMSSYDGIAGAMARGWAIASAYDHANGLIWAPSIAPGYIDDRAVPGNPTITIDRANGAAYDQQWNNVLSPQNGQPDWITITSFNEWHEGSQIEPASNTPPGGFGYLTYNNAYGLTGTAAEQAYLTRTKHWVDIFDPQNSTVPGPASNLKATPGNAQVSLTWSAGTNVTSYNVKRSATSGGPYTTIQNVTGTSYTNTGLTNNTPYYYTVYAVNGSGESIVGAAEAGATPFAGVNLVANPGFESGTGTDAANWTEGTQQTRNPGYKSGNWLLRADYTGTGTSATTSSAIGVATNTTYTLSGWVYILKAGSPGRACIDLNGLTGQPQLCTATGGLELSQWKYLSTTWNSGTNTSVTVRLFVDSTPQTTWFDDIRLSNEGGPAPTPTFTPTAGPTPTPTNTSAPSSNVIQNPSFETAGTGGAADAANWTEFANQVRASDKFNTGAWSLKSTITTNGATSQSVSVVASTAYTYSGYAWKTNTVGNACIDMADLVGEVQKCTTAAGSWVFLTGAWNSGTNTALTVRVYVDGNPTGAIWFDDISLAGPGGPTLTPTNTPIPPTNTPTRTNTPTPTNTPLGPTNTPTNTFTPAPPTNTPTNTSIPPTNTPTNTPVPSGNAVQNSSFETAGTGGAADAANWTEGTLHARASDKFNTGAWSLKSTYRSTGTDTRQTMTITANHTYTYSGYIWRTNTVGGACMDMNDIAGELTLCATTAGSWQFKTGTWSSGALTSLTVRLITDASPTGDIWFDDISLQ